MNSFFFIVAILEESGNNAVDAESIMHQLVGDVLQTCPPDVNFHSARTVVEDILASRNLP